MTKKKKTEQKLKTIVLTVSVKYNPLYADGDDITDMFDNMVEYAMSIDSFGGGVADKYGKVVVGYFMQERSAYDSD